MTYGTQGRFAAFGVRAAEPLHGAGLAPSAAQEVVAAAAAMGMTTGEYARHQADIAAQGAEAREAARAAETGHEADLRRAGLYVGPAVLDHEIKFVA